ncbi:MAG: phosphoribosyl-AMP cyclohydrolase, partial [Nanoarchaeota archaeon]
MIIPSIDLMNGKAVQLRQGKEFVLEREDVLELAKEFRKYGEIAVVDLDAAFGKGENRALIEKICKIAPCRVGGGIRTKEEADKILQMGAKKIMIGTKASVEFLKDFSKDRIIVCVDAKDGVVVNKGWKNKTEKTPEQVIEKLENYCSEFLCTNVNTEGMMQGIDFEFIKKVRAATKKKITIAGGITTLEDIRVLEELDCNSQIGMAIYTKKINLPEAFISVLNFEKNNGLIATVVRDQCGQVLMQAWSNKESLQKTFVTTRATYYSRSRNALWTKGETSGNTQEFITARYDCDRDTVLFIVSQKNAACHTGMYSCFEEREFSIQVLYETLVQRISEDSNGSYTAKIAKDEKAIMKKIKEEADEVINYRDRENLVWEIADVTYFLLVLMAKKGITPKDIEY